MRTALFLAALIAAPLSFAQTTPPQRPATPAPSAAATFEQREAWCQQFTSWFVASTPQTSAAPSDVRASHEYEVEFNSCKLDPQRYERDTQTLAQLARTAQPERG